MLLCQENPSDGNTSVCKIEVMTTEEIKSQLKELDKKTQVRNIKRLQEITELLCKTCKHETLC